MNKKKWSSFRYMAEACDWINNLQTGFKRSKNQQYKLSSPLGCIYAIGNLRLAHQDQHLNFFRLVIFHIATRVICLLNIFLAACVQFGLADCSNIFYQYVLIKTNELSYNGIMLLQYSIIRTLFQKITCTALHPWQLKFQRWFSFF